MNVARKPSNVRLKSDVRSDVLASIVVFLVALPLCMGIAIASGAPVSTGLITGIVGGLVVGCLSGCPLQVSGPAAGLTVIVYDTILKFGLELLGLVVLMAGAMQVAAGLLQLGQWFRAVSPAVVKGMLAGIGFLILGSQFHVMIDDQPKGSGALNLATIPDAVAKSLEWPALGDRAVRTFRARALQNVGELHRRLLNAGEGLPELAGVSQLAEAAATESVDAAGLRRTASAAAEPAGTGRTTDALAPPVREALLREYRHVAAELERTVEKARALKQQTPGANNLRETQAMAAAALVDAKAALAAIEAGQAGDVIRAHSGAVESLESLLDRLKNHHLAAFVGISTILLIVSWQAFAPKRLKAIPAPLVAVMIATAAAYVLTLPILDVEIPDRLWEDVRWPSWNLLIGAPWAELWQSALLMAVVASAETLLCCSAVDQMHQGQRTRYDRELLAQGVGNMACGTLGALPMTGVIVRSSANVQAGGKTRLSAILHGAWLLLFVAGLTFLLRMMPTASLAAVLVYTGYKLVDVKSLRDLTRYGWGEVAIYAATIITIVTADLLTGVLVGIGLSAVKLLYTFSHLSTRLETSSPDGRAVLRLHGAATFIRLPRLADVLERVPATAELHVDFEHLDYIDHACLDLLMTWARQHQAGGGKLVIDWDSLHARFYRETNGQRAPAAQRAVRAESWAE